MLRNKKKKQNGNSFICLFPARLDKLRQIFTAHLLMQAPRGLHIFPDAGRDGGKIHVAILELYEQVFTIHIDGKQDCLFDFNQDLIGKFTQFSLDTSIR
uniref:Uncharacterized protein n=1 Tax=Candidatus Kentrum sp. SD TaxID=2126332 RepID=A0A450Y7Z5_9GAMM|nr:MAG: hypothetical protein BECKSD772F_GA0070984_101725 [Candidatus Kentron sp. SD]VFK41304.1 MAG: hypothetical protein BECKSD772E_GA0070983_101120 [Candidatus Kentron sp. SD]